MRKVSLLSINDICEYLSIDRDTFYKFIGIKELRVELTPVKLKNPTIHNHTGLKIR